MRPWRLAATLVVAALVAGRDARAAEQVLVSPAPAAADHFGAAVAAIGPDVVAGAPDDSTGGTAYRLDGTTGARIATFANPTAAGGDRFGAALAIVGANVLVGAPGDDTAGADAGATYLFDGATGVLLQTFLEPTPAAARRFGVAVAARGTNVLVSAPGPAVVSPTASRGAVYLFDAASGAVIRSFPDPTGTALDILVPRSFGIALAVVGGNV